MLKFLIGFLSIISFFVAGVSYAEEGNDKDWEVNITPYIMFLNLNGNATVGPVSGPIDLSFKDLLKNFEFGAMLHSEIRKGRFGLMLDGMYGKLSAATDLDSGATVSSEIEVFILEALGYYRFPTTKGKVDIFAGIRYWYLDFDVNFTLNEIALRDSFTPDWVDPVIGVRTIQTLSPKWYMIIRADIGGFGVSSDFAWNIQGGVGRKLGKSSSVFLGYKYLKTDYSNDVTGPGFFAFDAAMHGVFLGFNFSFGPKPKTTN